jgi:DnaK suppressor protein
MAGLSPEFIQAQQKRLQALRAQLLGAEYTALTSERTSREDHGGEAGDAVDKAQDQIQRDVDQALQDVDAPRLRSIDRALQKIAEGTYGISDVSGKPIPKERLEATPEAVLTVQEEKTRR